LFVGESAPHSGDFFYRGDSAMLRHMRCAVEQVLGKSDNFLASFKAYGWYLDDLVWEPVNHLPPSRHKAKCVVAEKRLADRIADYQPEAIVILLRRIKPFVDAAANLAGSKAPRFVVPFPGLGHQTRFQTEMATLIPKLPRLTWEI